MAFVRQLPDRITRNDPHLIGSVLERQRVREPDPSVHFGRWAAAALVVCVALSFGIRQMKRHRARVRVNPRAAEQVAQAQAEPAAALPKAAANPPSAPATNSAAVRQTAVWATESDVRSRGEQILLERLHKAETEGNTVIAIDAIEKLRKFPTMADLDDKLARRLGTLNMKLLLSGQPTPWTKVVSRRPGETPYRIARDHGTTVAAMKVLNHLLETHAFTNGTDKVRVLEFPRAALIIHRKTGVADFTLNGKFFKRYYVRTGEKTKPGVYPITRKPNEGPLGRFKSLELKLATTDEEELGMFFAPGAQFTVSDL